MRRKTVYSAMLLAVTMLVATACGGTATEGADDFPTKALTLYVVNPPGSAPDSNARALAQGLEEELGSSVVIKNVPGGAGMVGLAELAAEEPDGYSIAYAASNNLTSQPQLVETAFTGIEQIDPIAQVAEIPAVVFVNSSSEIVSVDDLIDAAKERPGEIKFGIPAVTSIQNMQLEIFAREAGITFDKIATGAGQQVLPVVNGTLEAGVVQPGPIQQYIEKGDLRIVGVLGTQVPDGLDAATFADAGYPSDYQGYEGIVAPQGVPEERLRRLEEAIGAAVEGEQFQGFIQKAYIMPSYLGAEEYGERLEKDVATSARYIEEFDLKEAG